jgi:hypothetical protein
MLKRSESTESLMEVSLVVEHFRPASMNACSCSHRAGSGVDLRGVNKTCRPGDTRDVNGGVDVYGVGDAQRM